MEKVDQTINAVCEWIQENLTDIGCMESTVVMPEMVKALAELVNSQIKLSVNESVGKLKEVKGMRLSGIKTCDLVTELEKREGVEKTLAEPYQVKDISVQGPAVVLVVTD